MDLETLKQLKEISDRFNEMLKKELENIVGDRIGEVYTSFEYHTPNGLILNYPLSEAVNELDTFGKLLDHDTDF